MGESNDDSDNNDASHVKLIQGRKESKNNENFRKLINGLVVWLIVCNAPYIAWYHWVQGQYIEYGRMWSDIPGGIARR